MKKVLYTHQNVWSFLVILTPYSKLLVRLEKALINYLINSCNVNNKIS